MKSFSTIVVVALVSGMVGAQSDKIIDAARFVVFGKSGKPAVVMTTDEIDAGAFAVYDNTGKEVFAVRGGRIVNADLDQRFAKLSAGVEPAPHQTATEGSKRIVDELKASKLSIVDSKGRVRIVIGVEERGTAGVAIMDTEGKNRILLCTDSPVPGTSSISIFDINQPRISMLYEQSGIAGFSLIDPAGECRIMAAVSNDGQVILPTSDNKK